MSDSFFTARNQIDPQVEHASTLFCGELIEASPRRIAKVEGPFETAKRLQRIADICAGAYVLPIEHWQKLQEPAAADEIDDEPEPLPAWRFDKRFDRFMLKYPMLLFYFGVAVGWFLWGRS